MTLATELRFLIDVFTPETLPMGRLADYMSQLAMLLGEVEHVHFVGLEGGSAVLTARADPVAVPAVERRLADASCGRGDPVALKAVQTLDDMLANDNAIGRLLDHGGVEIIAFKGRDRPKPLEYGPFPEEGVLEGVVYRMGGTADVVPISLIDGTCTHRCSAKRALARQIAPHYDGGVLRVWGTGTWMRLANGAWIMRSFEIKSFELLDDAPLADVVKRLQAVEGADWGDDPATDLMRLRIGEGVN